MSAPTLAATTCSGALPGPVNGDVVVPAGASCEINAARITGNVTVGTNARLLVTASGGDTTIGGNIKGNACDYILLDAGSAESSERRIVVGGDLTITNCTGNTNGANGGFDIRNPLLIGGNVKCDNNPGGCGFYAGAVGGNLECNGNDGCTVRTLTVGGNVTINNGGGGFVQENAIGGDLKCNGNTGALTGNDNTVAGNKTGQCSGL